MNLESVLNDIKAMSPSARIEGNEVVCCLQANPVFGAVIARAFETNGWFFLVGIPAIQEKGEGLVLRKLKSPNLHRVFAHHLFEILNASDEPVSVGVENDASQAIYVRTNVPAKLYSKDFLDEAVRAILSTMTQYFPAFYAITEVKQLNPFTEKTAAIGLMQACDKTVDDRITIFSDLALRQQYQNANDPRVKEIDEEIVSHLKSMESYPALAEYVKYVKESLGIKEDK